MSFPTHEFEFQGGCHCDACHFQALIPALESRPGYVPAAQATPRAADIQLPVCILDHSVDNRRATGSILDARIVTDLSWVKMKFLSKSGENLVEAPAAVLFDPENGSLLDCYLTAYADSADHLHWFCSRCGTSIADTARSMNGLVEICMGCLDHNDIEKDYMAPQIQLHKEQEVPWLGKCSGRGLKSRYQAGTKTPRTIEEVLEHSRSGLIRITPQETWAELTARPSGPPPVFIDIRPAAQREWEGMIKGALIIERNVLEWRLDPKSDARLPFMDRYGLRVIVFCQEGYTSSLAAHALRDLGIDATDMTGGYRAWREAGLPEQLPVATLMPTCDSATVEVVNSDL